jgi:hypothetical protein
VDHHIKTDLSERRTFMSSEVLGNFSCIPKMPQSVVLTQGDQLSFTFLRKIYFGENKTCSWSSNSNLKQFSAKNSLLISYKVFYCALPVCSAIPTDQPLWYSTKTLKCSSCTLITSCVHCSSFFFNILPTLLTSILQFFANTNLLSPTLSQYVDEVNIPKYHSFLLH